jgi:hypothetical protein
MKKNILFKALILVENHFLSSVSYMQKLSGHWFALKAHLMLENISIFSTTVLLYIEEHFSNGHFYYYQDNSPIHRARTVRKWFGWNTPVH